MHKLFSWHQCAWWSFRSLMTDDHMRTLPCHGSRKLTFVAICIVMGWTSPTQGGETPLPQLSPVVVLPCIMEDVSRTGRSSVELESNLSVVCYSKETDIEQRVCCFVFGNFMSFCSLCMVWCGSLLWCLWSSTSLCVNGQESTILSYLIFNTLAAA